MIDSLQLFVVHLEKAGLFACHFQILRLGLRSPYEKCSAGIHGTSPTRKFSESFHMGAFM